LIVGLSAGLVLPDGGAGVLRDMPGSRDALLWRAVSRKVESDVASRMSGYASSRAWGPGARAAVDLLPFASHECGAAASAVCVVDGDHSCEVCRKERSVARDVLRLFGPIVDTAGLMDTTVSTSIAVPVPSSAAGPVATAAGAGSLRGAWWTDHIPRGRHAVYAQEFRAGAMCRQRIQAYSALRHFKVRLLFELSVWVRKELGWPRSCTPRVLSASLGASAMQEHTARLLRHVEAAEGSSVSGSATDDGDFSNDSDIAAYEAEASAQCLRGAKVDAITVRWTCCGGRY
jgi:hypothetical protein